MIDRWRGAMNRATASVERRSRGCFAHWHLDLVLLRQLRRRAASQRCVHARGGTRPPSPRASLALPDPAHLLLMRRLARILPFLGGGSEVVGVLHTHQASSLMRLPMPTTSQRETMWTTGTAPESSTGASDWQTSAAERVEPSDCCATVGPY